MGSNHVAVTYDSTSFQRLFTLFIMFLINTFFLLINSYVQLFFIVLLYSSTLSLVIHVYLLVLRVILFQVQIYPFEEFLLSTGRMQKYHLPFGFCSNHPSLNLFVSCYICYFSETPPKEGSPDLILLLGTIYDITELHFEDNLWVICMNTNLTIIFKIVSIQFSVVV